MKYICITILTLALLLTPSMGVSNGSEINNEVYKASYYGEKFRGRPMACGGIPFNPDAFSTAATKDYKCGERLRVTNVTNGKSVEVVVLDRGNFGSKYGRTLDLSKGAFKEISPLSKGVISVTIEKLDLKDTWK